MRGAIQRNEIISEQIFQSLLISIFPQNVSIPRQIGTSNCVARYCTLSGGIGSPTPTTHSSDYVDDDEDENDDTTDKTAVLFNGTSSPAECSNATTSGSVAKHLKLKQNNHVSHSSKASTISYQKASVHYVRDCSTLLFSLRSGNMRMLSATVAFLKLNCQKRLNLTCARSLFMFGGFSISREFHLEKCFESLR